LPLRRVGADQLANRFGAITAGGTRPAAPSNLSNRPCARAHHTADRSVGNPIALTDQHRCSLPDSRNNAVCPDERNFRKSVLKINIIF
jgi:hypothetical protein